MIVMLDKTGHLLPEASIPGRKRTSLFGERTRKRKCCRRNRSRKYLLGAYIIGKLQGPVKEELGADKQCSAPFFTPRRVRPAGNFHLLSGNPKPYHEREYSPVKFRKNPPFIYQQADKVGSTAGRVIFSELLRNIFFKSEVQHERRERGESRRTTPI
jgi:hypothetical protein